jgi:hypothetical protein
MEKILRSQGDLSTSSSGYGTRRKDNSSRYSELLSRRTQAEKTQAEDYVPHVQYLCIIFPVTDIL